MAPRPIQCFGDDKQSYLHKVGTRYFTYLEITHPADRILVLEAPRRAPCFRERSINLP
jgi:hypothetical protein